jgi:pyrimidine operon attenuation protein/uracil phosphoribosyltransferase
MAPERVKRTLSRLAYEVVERNRGATDLEIFGILRSGTVVADALAQHIGAIEAHAFAAHPLDVQPFRDDRDRSVPSAAPAEHPIDVTDRAVILVDDVLFTGRTARAALDAVIRYGRPRSIQLVVLIDRGHREYPIQPDYIGRTLPTKHKERVVVDVNDGFAVYVEE